MNIEIKNNSEFPTLLINEIELKFDNSKILFEFYELVTNCNIKTLMSHPEFNQNDIRCVQNILAKKCFVNNNNLTNDLNYYFEVPFEIQCYINWDLFLQEELEQSKCGNYYYY